MIGNALGDALGAHTEFLDLDTERQIIMNEWSELENYCENFKQI